MFKKKNENITYKCVVHLLDDFDIVELEYLDIHNGSYLIEKISHQLKIKEKDYFGLRYLDTGKQRQWLDLEKIINKQCKDIKPLIFSFRVKFYPADPFLLSINVRRFLYKQLKRDINHGRIYCTSGDFITFEALIVQEEMEDYNEKVHIDDYISTLQQPTRQIDATESEMMNKHKVRKRGQEFSSVIDEFLEKACSIESYGIEPHCVKDQQGVQLYIGVNFSGISAFMCGKRSQHFRWVNVRKLNFEGRMFIAHLCYTDTSRELKKYTVGFKCASGAACRYLWRSAIEHMLFFTLPDCGKANKNYGGGIFSRGTKFKYAGRTEREVITDIFLNSNFQTETNDKKANSVPATPSSPTGDLSTIRYNSLPRSVKSELFDRLQITDTSNFVHDKFAMTYAEATEMQNSYGIQMQIPVTGTTYNSSNKWSHGLPQEESINSLKHFDNTISICSPNIKRNPIILQNKRNSRKFHILRLFFPSLVFVIASMLLFALVILESRFEFFEVIRNVPEMIVLKNEYYIPLKNFIYKEVFQ